MSEIINELLEKLKQCDDFHNRCDFLMEHSEITYMLDYITKLQKENKKLENQIDKSIEYIQNHQLVFRYHTTEEIDEWLNQFYKDVLDILRGGMNE